MTRIAVPFVFLVLLAGCATARQTYAPDGRVGYTINCSGAALNWGLCFQKAGDICGARGYDIITANGENAGEFAEANRAAFFAVPVVNRDLLIACKR